MDLEVLESGQAELFIRPDPDGDREWVRKHKSMKLIDKQMTEAEAVEKLIKDGDYIGFELYGTVRCSNSIAREIVRQKKKNLQIMGQATLEVDFLLAADLVSRIDISYVGYEVYGISGVLRRAVEQGKVKVAEWSNGGLTWRLKAASMNIPFIPIRSMLGSDTFAHSAAKVVKCPFTGQKVCVVPATTLDVGIIHVHRADKYGNCHIDGISGFAFELSRACRKLIISTEEIIDNEVIRSYPDRTIIPHFLVDAVVRSPFGAHPGEMAYLYGMDEEHTGEYLEAGKSEEAVQRYLERYIYGTSNHIDYLKKVGSMEKLLKLKSTAGRRQ